MKTTQKTSGLAALAPYLRALRDIPRLPREEEHAIAVRARSGDAVAKEQLVRHSLGLVVAVARKQRRGTVPLDDLIQEGSLGLMRAAEKFDPRAGTRFGTYAVWWIRAYIGKYLKEARSAVRPKSGTVAVPDVSLDIPVEEDEEATRLPQAEETRLGPEDIYLSSESDRRVREPRPVHGSHQELLHPLLQAPYAHLRPRRRVDEILGR